MVENITARKKPDCLTDEHIRGKVLIGKYARNADGFGKAVGRNSNVPMRILTSKDPSQRHARSSMVGWKR